jgi:hypothetical protein
MMKTVVNLFFLGPNAHSLIAEVRLPYVTCHRNKFCVVYCGSMYRRSVSVASYWFFPWK